LDSFRDWKEQTDRMNSILNPGDQQESAGRPASAGPAYLKLLDPEAMARINRLEILARHPVEGFISGRHRSPYRGFSVEFAEHREYAPGDDLRDLDWRAYAKSDRYYIKQYIEETNLRATILLDASGSMAYRGENAARHNGTPLSKFEYARLLAASLVRLLLNQQDAVGLVTFDTSIRRYLPSRCRTNYMSVLLEELFQTEPGEETALAPVFHEIAERIHRRGLLIIISDLFGPAEDILKALHHFRFRKHDVIVMHVMADEELTFPFKRWSQFRDLEHTGHQVDIDPEALRSAYLAEVRAFLDAIETGCGEMRADYVPFSTRQDFDMALAGYLSHRRSLVK
jgi:uncharacterized protein (DUF58 family)